MIKSKNEEEEEGENASTKSEDFLSYEFLF